MARAPTAAGKSTIVIRREEEGGHAHHGGAWKVAYADFVTAMMAFFLLMWLLNATTQEQKRGIADYFSSTPNSTHAGSATENPWGGKSVFEDGTALSDRGAVPVTTAMSNPVDAEDEDTDTVAVKVVHAARGADDTPAGPQNEAAKPGAVQGAARPAHARAASQARLGAGTSGAEQGGAEDGEAQIRQAAEAIRVAIAADPALRTLAGQVKVELTPDGMRIQIVDTDGQPMFPAGSAMPSERLRLLMHRVVPVLAHLPGTIAADGYTDAQATAAGQRDNWDLSAARANATRRLLQEDGVAAARVDRVTGHADRDLLLPKTPLAAGNRRIALTVLNAPAAP